MSKTKNEQQFTTPKAYWIPLISLLILGATMLCCWSIWFDMPKWLHNVRWFFINTRWSVYLFAIVVLLVVISLTVYSIYRYSRRPETEKQTAVIIGIFMLAFTSACAWIFILPRLELLPIDHTQLASVVFNDHLYTADAEYQSSPLSSSIYAHVVVWECDRFGLLCSNIFSYGVKIGGSEDFDKLTVDLQRESETLVITINHKVVYTYAPGQSAPVQPTPDG